MVARGRGPRALGRRPLLRRWLLSGSLPWLGGAARARAASSPPRGRCPAAVAVVPLALLAALARRSRSRGRSCPTAAGSTRTARFVYSPSPRSGSWLAPADGAALGLMALLGAVVVWSLLGKALPRLYEDYGRVARLRGPVGYWNQLALLGDFALALALSWHAAARAGTLLVYGWLVALALTYSRGGVLVAARSSSSRGSCSRASGSRRGDARRGGAARRSRGRARLRARRASPSDGETHVDALARRADLRRARRSWAPASRSLLCRVPPSASRRPRCGVPARAGRGASRSAASWSARVTPLVVGLVHELDGAESQSGSAASPSAGSNFRWEWWQQAWRGWEEHPARRAPARARSTSRTCATAGSFLDHDDRAAQPAAAVPLGDGRRRARALRRRGRSRSSRPRGGGAAAAARARAGPARVPPPLPGRRRLGLRRGRAPVFLVAGALAARPDRCAPAARCSAVLAGARARRCAFAVLALRRWLGGALDGRGAQPLDRPRARSQLADRARSDRPARSSSRSARRRSPPRRSGATRGGVRHYYVQATSSCSRRTRRPGTRSASSTFSSATAHAQRCT